MPTDDPTAALSPEASQVLDQLVDIAHDEARPEDAAIEWYTPDEDPPAVALGELQRAGIVQHRKDGRSVVVSLTAEGIRRYV